MAPSVALREGSEPVMSTMMASRWKKVDGDSCANPPVRRRCGAFTGAKPKKLPKAADPIQVTCFAIRQSVRTTNLPFQIPRMLRGNWEVSAIQAY